jgi:acyl-CoA thioester hydrolase
MIYYNHHFKVFYRDVDKMGIVYYSRYFEYFEEGRTEMLKSIGLSINNIENSGILLPVVTAHCNYKKGLELEQKTILEVSILEMPKSRLKILYEIKSGNDIKNIYGYTEHAFIKQNGRPTKVPNIILDAIKKNKI